jgi:hypothetical protein
MAARGFHNHWLVAGATVALATAGCDDHGPTRPCTLVDCEVNGLTVRVEGTLPTVYMVTVSSPNEEARSRVCWTPAHCVGGAVHFAGYSPAEVSITVEWEDGTATATAEPTYQVFRPNGPDCEPVCRTATITVQLT